MADVPCGTCHLCCKMLTPLRDTEYSKYQWMWVQGRRALKRKPNGDCFYLADTGCSIHDRAPKVCQDFDCRKMKNRDSGPMIYDRGQELLNASASAI